MTIPPGKPKWPTAWVPTREQVFLAMLLLLSSASAIASDRVAQLAIERWGAQADQLHVFVNPRYRYRVTYRGKVRMEVIGDTEYDDVTFESGRGIFGVR